ncbi:hypothetical protein [Clostridium sp. AWRP]|uniref:hyaluronate lyase N-terminal domain-containing protein n=1 Tax=Clostridium sp. AWRP TaxID=2212991 RepID=UPI001586C902|nr:hypothetical protein [Clostridium sp. AWRP]
MANKIQLRRGLKANLPTLDVGEPAFCTDTKELYIGTANGNVKMSDPMDVLKFETAGGTATEITLTIPNLANGISKTFIASANNNGEPTTINGYGLYKPNTTTAPNLIGGKAYTVWFAKPSQNSPYCFFIKASAEGDAVAENVLAEKKFSNDNDTGIPGTMPDNGAVVITPNTSNQPIGKGYHNGSGYVKGDSNLQPKYILKDKPIFGVNGTLSIESLGGKRFKSNSFTVTQGQTLTIPLDFNPSAVIVVINYNGKNYYSCRWGDYYYTPWATYSNENLLANTYVSNLGINSFDFHSDYACSCTYIAME